ncbi:hypothetical protein MO973_21065 [Paenibacillus sp. TRM 82003]|nr:hypothetical protein [Paenibacillus sp. TRM 82003]
MMTPNAIAHVVANIVPFGDGNDMSKISAYLLDRTFDVNGNGSLDKGDIAFLLERIAARHLD